MKCNYSTFSLLKSMSDKVIVVKKLNKLVHINTLDTADPNYKNYFYWHIRKDKH